MIYAFSQGARVIVIEGVSASTSNAYWRGAISFAQSAGALVIIPAGDHGLNLDTPAENAEWLALLGPRADGTGQVIAVGSAPSFPVSGLPEGVLVVGASAKRESGEEPRLVGCWWGRSWTHRISGMTWTGRQFILDPDYPVYAPLDERRPIGSNWGPTAVHLTAPGDRIVSRGPDGQPIMASGTMAAAGIVAGVAASLMSAWPDAPVEWIRQRILDTTRVSPHLTGRVATGEISPMAALCLPGGWRPVPGCAETGFTDEDNAAPATAATPRAASAEDTGSVNVNSLFE